MPRLALKPASSYQGSSPSIFIGSYGWPDMHGGPLLTNDSDSPPDWLDRNLGIEEIVSIRARTISGRSILPSVADNLQEIARSTIPLDVDVVFEKPVTFSLNFDGTIAPVGFTGPVKKMEVLGNARVERVVERITSDTDMSATDACGALRESAIDVYQIANLMTAGLLGKRRTFVPPGGLLPPSMIRFPSSLKKRSHAIPRLKRSVFLPEKFLATGLSVSLSRATGSTR